MMGSLIGILIAVAVALPLAWKWQLGVRRALVAMLLLAVCASVLVGGVAGMAGDVPARPVVVAAVALGLAAAGVAYRFYRDPERAPPTTPGLVLSPADGEVLYVRRARHGVLPVSTKHGRSYRLDELTRTPLHLDDAVVVGIGLSLLDVHVNRTPITGRLTLVRRFPGTFGSLRRTEMVFENERATIQIEGEVLSVAMVLIASRLVRRIVLWVEEGQALLAGQRIGMIRFGSQVDLVLPARPDLTVMVAPGERVVAGTTVVAALVGAAELVMEARLEAG